MLPIFGRLFVEFQPVVSHCQAPMGHLYLVVASCAVIQIVECVTREQRMLFSSTMIAMQTTVRDHPQAMVAFQIDMTFRHDACA